MSLFTSRASHLDPPRALTLFCRSRSRSRERPSASSAAASFAPGAAGSSRPPPRDDYRGGGGGGGGGDRDRGYHDRDLVHDPLDRRGRGGGYAAAPDRGRDGAPLDWDRGGGDRGGRDRRDAAPHLGASAAAVSVSAAASSRVDDRFLDEDDDDEATVGVDGRVGEYPHYEDGALAPPPPSAPPPLPPGPAPPAPPSAPAFAIPDGVDEEEFMARMLGFSGFDSTHGKHVEDNGTSAARGAVSKVLKREYRQYMNRKGGFNKPLAAQAPMTRK